MKPDDPTQEEEVQAALLAIAIAGRPDRLTSVAVEVASEEVGVDLTGAYRDTGEALAGFAVSLPREAPPTALRARILSTLAAKPIQKPKRALLVVDMIVDYLTPGRPLEVPRARDIVPAIAARLEAARKEGVPVIYIVDQHKPGDGDLELWGAHAIEGTEGDEVWPALAPQPGDRVVHKPTYSAFSRSTLDEVLAELKVDTLVLTGCLTEIGLFCTAKDALERGFAVELPREAQAGSSARTEHVALGVLNLLLPYAPARQELLARVA
ncbi:MAG: isochorismatase family cysteine hydrolase [Polyangiaceae bacterium]